MIVKDLNQLANSVPSLNSWSPWYNFSYLSRFLFSYPSGPLQYSFTFYVWMKLVVIAIFGYKIVTNRIKHKLVKDLQIY